MAAYVAVESEPRMFGILGRTASVHPAVAATGPIPEPALVIEGKGDGGPADEELVERVLRGEEDAFVTLYERYRLRVAATVGRILRDPEDARDALQEIFIKVYRRMSEWDRGRAKFSTWLYRLAANHAIDCWRQRRRSRTELPWTALREGKVLPAASFGAPSILLELERHEQIAEITRYMNALPLAQRKLFVLRHCRGMKLREIAEQEGMNLGTVKTSLYRALRSIREKIERRRGIGKDGGIGCMSPA